MGGKQGKTVRGSGVRQGVFGAALAAALFALPAAGQVPAQQRTHLDTVPVPAPTLGFSGLNPVQVPAPPKLRVRPSRAVDPGAWRTDWSRSVDAPAQLRDLIAPDLAEQGIDLVALAVDTNSAELRFTNHTYMSQTLAIGRAARVLARYLPASVETFRLVPVNDNLALARVVVRRSDLEALEPEPNAAEALLAVTGIGDAPPDLPGSVSPDGAYPRFKYAVSPYITPSYTDPDEAVRADVGLALSGKFRPAPGWTLAGTYRYRLAGNIADARQPSNSVLPRVRTNEREYARGSAGYVADLYASYQWKPSATTYARITAGYLERMFGGISGEVLLKPVNSRLALGVEANYVKQRDFGGAFDFQDYSVVTGHVSAYYEFARGYLAQVDVGRYLAGDVGATFTLGREFGNGWRVDGFFTLTDVSAEDFGDGSFDKGIRVTIPLNGVLGTPSRQRVTQTIRPAQRDGGARLIVPNRLYEQVRGAHRNALVRDWARVWE